MVIEFGGSKPDMLLSDMMPVCALSETSLGKSLLFANLLPRCEPIETKFQHCRKNGKSFIHQEITQLLAENIIEPSISPWQHRLL